MTASDIEGRLTELLHHHAEEAMSRTDTTTELSTFRARVDRDTGRQHRRRRLLASAAAAAAVVGTGGTWWGLQQSESPPTATTPSTGSSSSPSPSPSLSQTPAPEPAQTPGSTVRGFDGIEEFPMRFVVPPGFSEASEGGGTRGYVIDGTSGAAGAFVLSTFADTRAADVPADVAALIRESRDDLVVSDVRSTEVGGRDAQAFTLAQRPGTAASELWCARVGSCFKLLEDKPMDMTVVRTPNGLVLFEVEYVRADRAQVRARAQRWLASVRWE